MFDLISLRTPASITSMNLGRRPAPRWPLFVLSAFIVSVLSATSQSATGAEGAEGKDRPTGEPSGGGAESGNADLENYAEAYGVPQKTAQEQWAAIDIARELQAVLRERQRNSFGGLWIDYEPQFSIVVMSVAGGEGAAQEEIDLLGLASTTRIDQSDFTLRELEHQQAGLAEVAPFGVDYSSAISIRTGRVEVYVEGQEDVDAMEDSELPPAAVVVEEELPTPAAVYGGLSLNVLCTTGFSVEETNGFEQGVTTAGHCPNSVSYAGINLPFQEGQWSGHVDAQWHTTPNEADPNKIKVNVSGATRIVNARRPWNQMIDGEPVCKYGRITNYDCGQIINFNFDPSDNCVPDSSNTYVRVEPNPMAGDLAETGDSGGPVFHDDPARAYGQIVCQFGSSPDMAFMPQNFMPAGIGVQVDI
jgi:hypothetical protein